MVNINEFDYLEQRVIVAKNKRTLRVVMRKAKILLRKFDDNNITKSVQQQAEIRYKRLMGLIKKMMSNVK